MSTAATATIVATNSANISAANARRQRQECEAFMEGFHGTASVEDIQAYAQCANLLHPQAESDYTGVAVLFLISVVIGIIGGVVTTFKERDFFLGIIAGMLWFLAVWVICFFVALVVASIHYLM